MFKSKKITVAFLSAEVAPLAKVGGLGDVAASLPRALGNLDIDIRIVIPFYKVLKLGRSRKKLVKHFTLKYLILLFYQNA